MKRSTSAAIRWLTSDNAQVLVGAFALVCLLLYTAVHTAALLARYIEPDFFGYAAAAGIEFSIVAFSLRIGQKRKAAKADAEGKVKVRGVRKYAFVIGAALVVSALANLSEGYTAAHPGETFEFASLLAHGVAQGVILVAATALISVLVFALADIIGGDVRTAADAAERAERTERKRSALEANDGEQDDYGERASSALSGKVLAPVLPLFRCECGREFKTLNAMNAHKWRWCALRANEKGAVRA